MIGPSIASFFFFKQKTAYEMRISDWSSDVCSSDLDELFASATGILELRQRAHTRLFMRRDRYGRFFTCMVFVPRDRFNTTVRERIESMLGTALHAGQVDSPVQSGRAAPEALNTMQIGRRSGGEKGGKDGEIEGVA